MSRIDISGIAISVLNLRGHFLCVIEIGSHVIAGGQESAGWTWFFIQLVEQARLLAFTQGQAYGVL